MISKLKNWFFASFLLSPLIVFAQQAETITGTVTDMTGEPLIGVSVYSKGSSTGVTTDIDGVFSIKVPMNSVLTFSYIGYDTKEVKVNSTKLDVIMEENATQLNEVVVTALGIQRKESSLTYATQAIKGSDLMKVQDANFVNSLGGKVSGVTITQSAGGAGGTSKILLRGNKSVMGNNAPLIVVDGIPMTNEAKGASSNWDGGTGLDYASSSEGGDALSLINPDDIESINVLKGANAAALYGSAAANGVLMITTKKGKEGKIAVTLNSNVTWDKPLTTPNLQYVYGSPITVNPATGEAISMGIGAWGKKIGTYTPAEMSYAGTVLRDYARNNVNDFFNTGTTWNNSITVSGGTEKIRSFFSYSNSNSHGMVPNNYYNRNTFAFRQNYNFFKDRLKIDLSINYVDAKTKNRPGGGTVMNPLYDLYRLPGNIDFLYYKNNYVNQNGSWVTTPMRYLDSTGGYSTGSVTLTGPQQIWAYHDTPSANNPFWLTNMNLSEQREQRVYGSAAITLNIIDGLNVQGRLNMDRATLNGLSNRYATTQNVSQREDYGMYGQNFYQSMDWYVDVMATYQKTFKEDYYVSASTGWIGHTVRGRSQNQWVQASFWNNLSNRSLPERINYFEPTAYWNGNGISWGNSSNWDKGWFLTGQFGWRDMVFVEGSYRIDWYRAFRQFAERGTPDHYGYWSVGANTLLHKYITMPTWITNAKIRASYSEVGNSIPNQVFAKSTTNLGNGTATAPAYGYFDNPRPENSKSFEAGFDLGLMNYRLNWDFTYYNTNLTNSYFLAATTGGKSKPVNTGSIRNQGFETTINYNVISTQDWIWRTGLNLSFNDNKIKKTFKDEQGNPAKMEQLIANGSIAVRYAEGGSYGDMFALDFTRNEDGSIYIDPNSGTPIKSSSDWIYLGNMNSKWNLGWSNTVSWKDLSLYFLISGRIGGKFISLTEAYLDYAGMSQRSADARLNAEANNIYWTAADGTQKPGMYVQGTLVPVEDYYKTIGGQRIASEYVYDATNIRLGELSLTYQFHRPFHGFLQNITVSAVGRNLFFFYKKAPNDPDIALSTKNGLGAFDIFNMPSARSFGLNLKIEF